LVGSSDFINYFPSFHNGISICARCALAFQFAPLISYRVGGKPCIVSCNNLEVIKELGKEALRYINEQRVLGAYQSKIPQEFTMRNFDRLKTLYSISLTRLQEITGIKELPEKTRRSQFIMLTTTIKIPRESQFTRFPTMYSVL